MEKLIRQAERRGIDRAKIADQTMFVSHETYTPARGGSASAEIHALRTVFGPSADSVVIANTKGFTGHAMGAGIEEVVAVKALETGIVPPVPNFREPDPELGLLNLSRGGAYPVEYALRLAAGFGSQISMTLLHWISPPDGMHRAPSELGFTYRIADEAAWRSWLAKMTGRDDAQLEVVQRRLRVADDATRQSPVTMPAAQAAPVHEAAAQAAPLYASATQAAPVREAAVPVAAPPRPASAGPVESAAAQPVATAEQAPERTAAAQAADPVTDAVLDIVAGLTGYPRDLLDLDLDLEADLGVDTVKQAEVFAAVRERFAIPRQDNLRLRDFPTLTHVIGFVHDNTAPAERAPAQAAPAKPAAGDAATEAPAAGPGPAEAARPGADPVTDAVLDIVAGLTGYPRDLLDLDLDLEADLGVDTVKQAEVFAAVRERFAIPRQDNLKLRDFPTITHVIGFVRDNTQQPPKAAAATAPAEAPAPAAAAAPDPASAQAADPFADAVLDIVESLTGYPRDLLDLDLDLEADLGVDTVKQAEVFAAVRERFAIPRQDNLKLRDFPTITHVIGFVHDHAVPAQPVPADATCPPSPWRSTRRPASPPPRRPKRHRRRSARRPPSPVTRRRRSVCRAASPQWCCGRPRSGASPRP